ncbi:MAG TPA: cytidine deaminase [Candidatus Syntrophoarchaeum butanivorans]|uniref:Cytidine deaminase n=1 Tax=Candidatus Syntropharchaeum butanivorans TaxID=1839936 RepID=A0A1F2P517_9EURY|nr:MAG: dCMP deaminase [Candidatus Syntrophoarchaeum butanivorans]RJS71957.1 MAG: cytidine deaminase [Candidatus Syntrophoarchaeum sp. WYZ-LMO15]HDM36807.1 cytidine deaminase [Candidatus Syntrophoarchaeum butanivorans]HEC57332.1 cytidine deaminase [Candidatus Syntrophoarchaeum butanivorans]
MKEEVSDRIGWDDYWMRITRDISLRSTCIRRKIGCVIVKDNIIVSTGYNGAPRGFPHCIERGCIRDKLGIQSGTRHEICFGVHAEQNALLQAGRDAAGATLYVNAYPCKICAKMILNASIRRVVISGTYSDTEGIELLRAGGVDVKILDDKGKKFKLR